ncbi:hypothetical protein AVEN_151006-1 [Araneus ventricosus]|uniref:Uncharacterized protein n=1 Tax=Araneus ventricosus TaxID=182803 RepID=A0A4Y2PDR3_ARAVE|nr:hypothetical protein AVEN_151006-1 [Araneus ventricosus]
MRPQIIIIKSHVPPGDKAGGRRRCAPITSQENCPRPDKSTPPWGPIPPPFFLPSLRWQHVPCLTCHPSRCCQVPAYVLVVAGEGARAVHVRVMSR